MRRLSIPDLTNGLASAVPGHRAGTGGVALSAGGERSHPEGRHVHEFPEAFLILDGHGDIEIDGHASPIAAGDVLVVAPGEDHHLVSSVHRPLVIVWLHLRAAE